MKGMCSTTMASDMVQAQSHRASSSFALLLMCAVNGTGDWLVPSNSVEILLQTARCYHFAVAGVGYHTTQRLFYPVLCHSCCTLWIGSVRHMVAILLIWLPALVDCIGWSMVAPVAPNKY